MVFQVYNLEGSKTTGVDVQCKGRVSCKGSSMLDIDSEANARVRFDGSKHYAWYDALYLPLATDSRSPLPAFFGGTACSCNLEAECWPGALFRMWRSLYSQDSGSNLDNCS